MDRRMSGRAPITSDDKARYMNVRLTSSIRGSKIPSNLLFFYILNFLPNLRPVLE
eukprot:SAG11_NODE_3142_length_2656_cov_3.797028_1_plen_54_part_10